MEKKRRKTINIQPFYVIIFLALFIFTVFMVYTGTSIQESYDIKVGSVSPQRFIAKEEMVNEYATNQKKEDAMEEVATLYKIDKAVKEKAVKDLDLAFVFLDKHIEENQNLEEDSDTNLENQTDIFVSDVNYKFYKDKAKTERNLIKDKARVLTVDAFERGIKENDIEKAIALLNDDIEKLESEEQTDIFLTSVVQSILKTNMTVDEDATLIAKEKAADEVEAVIILKNQKIVDENELVNEEIYSILDSLSYIKSDTKGNQTPLLGASILIFALLSSMLLYFRFAKYNLINEKRDALILLTLYVLILAIISLMRSLDYYLIPVSLFAMLVAILYDVSLAVYLNFLLVIIATLVIKAPIDFTIFFIISGTISAYLMTEAYKRNRIVLVGLSIALLNFFLTLGTGLFYGKGFSDSLIKNASISAFIGLFSIIVTVGSLPFWEGFFGLETSIRLIELTNPDAKLIRRLMIEAPGTYHHSLMVANLSETAAYDLGADATLARAASYYHDIGKIKYPVFYSENQNGENPHDQMSSEDSVEIIKMHTTNGIKLANEHKLPKRIKDIIIQHHGTSLIKYFYTTAVNELGEENVNKNDFRYKGVKPQCKESAIIMLADTVEAAVRANINKGFSLEETENFIEKLIKDKLDDGQLSESDLLIKDLETIRKSFMTIFSGAYHERVEYPEEIKKTKEDDDLGEIKI